MFKWIKDKFSKEKTAEVPAKEILNEEDLSQEKEVTITLPVDQAEKFTVKEDSHDDTVEQQNNVETITPEQITEVVEQSPVDSVFVNEVIQDEKYGDLLQNSVAQIDEEIIEDLNQKHEEFKYEEVSFKHSTENLSVDSLAEQKVKSEEEERDNELSVSESADKTPQKEISKPSLFHRLKQGLSKTRKEVGIKINTVLGSYVKIEDEMLEDLEDILISADIGMDTTMKLIDNLRSTIIREKINDPSLVKDVLKSETKKLMNESLSNKLNTTPPSIILVVGVNGVGKTTTIGKLASRLKEEGKSVLIAAADTFRAAAIDQLKEWGNRAKVEVIAHTEGADPAAVIFDGIAAAKSRNIDVLICDTAGRLHNKANLMKELEKINRVIEREYPGVNRENLLVLDATTGQNAMNQAKTFKEACELTGIALTKLDGTAKGGVVIALQSELQIPIKLIGVGEKIDDLQDFNMEQFVSAIFDE